jgi:hypothetical protein
VCGGACAVCGVCDSPGRELGLPVQTYGYNHIGTLSNLEQLGLIKKYDGSPPFASIKKTMRLIVTDVDEKDPKDIAYVYSGYYPLAFTLYFVICFVICFIYLIISFASGTRR